jgi:hypothetical protein
MAETVVILGAGATKACKGPLTNEILPEVFLNKADFPNAASLTQLEQFLQQNFHVAAGAPPQDYPGLPLLMSLIDTAIERRQAFHPGWDVDAVTQLRHAMELAIFDLLEYRLEKAPTNNHYQMLSQIYPVPQEPRIISMNYDVIIDAAVMFYAESRPPQATGAAARWRFPDYGCDISTDLYRNHPERFGTLLKLHGSLNWLYCPTCHRLEIGASEARPFVKALTSLVGAGHKLESFYLGTGSKCQTCGTELQALLIAPSHLKNYRNPHLTNLWYRAERLLRSANRAVFVGYSLPDDDVEVVYLLKRGLAHLSPADITVVEFDATNPDITLGAHPVGRRYRSLFGDGIAWSARGLDSWLRSSQVAANKSAVAKKAAEIRWAKHRARVRSARKARAARQNAKLGDGPKGRRRRKSKTKHEQISSNSKRTARRRTRDHI